MEAKAAAQRLTKRSRSSYKKCRATNFCLPFAYTKSGWSLGRCLMYSTCMRKPRSIIKISLDRDTWCSAKLTFKQQLISEKALNGVDHDAWDLEPFRCWTRLYRIGGQKLLLI